MAERDLDALVVRAPDNILYLTNYWGMKGYDVAIFPREGEPTLVTVASQQPDAERLAWTPDNVYFRSTTLTTRGRRLFVPLTCASRPFANETSTAAWASSSPSGRRRATAWSASRRRSPSRGSPRCATPPARCRDATPLLNETRAIKTDQEIARMRLANELAALAMEHVRDRIAPGMRAAEVAALWEGHVHATGIGFRDRVEMARGFASVWPGPAIRSFTPTSEGVVVEGEPTLFEIWVCADGYWCDHTKNLVCGDLKPAYADLLETLTGIYNEVTALAVDGAPLSELDRIVRERTAEAGYPGQPSHPMCHGVRRAGPRGAVRPSEGSRHNPGRHGSSLSSRGSTGRAAAGSA